MYNLPESLIADHPSSTRGRSRLLVLDKSSGSIQDKLYSNIVDYLNPGDLLVLNDTKVIKARLLVENENGSKREIIVLEKHSYDNDWHKHRILYRHKMEEGNILHINTATIIVDKILDGGLALVKSDQDLLRLVEDYGQVPLPPYMHRDAEPADVERYQTIWAKYAGSVAAPTASLNMTDDILTTIKQKGVKIAYVTLHVGLGTFLPIRTDFIEEHKMHEEYFEIPKETVDVINTTKKQNKRVVALGTTVARTLEYSSELINKCEAKISGEADIFIYPGYKFKTIDALLTNFHAPKSTVLMLTAAFAGWDNLRAAYEHAILYDYKFLSYGDSMLVV